MERIPITDFKRDVQFTILNNQDELNPNHNAYIEEDELGKLLALYKVQNADSLIENVVPTGNSVFETEEKENKNAYVTTPNANITEQNNAETEAEEAKKRKRRRIIIGVVLGVTAVAAGFLIHDLRQPDSVVKGFAKDLFKRTKLGNNIKEGMDFAREAHTQPMEKLADGGSEIKEAVKDFATRIPHPECEAAERMTEFVGNKFNQNAKLANEFAQDVIKRAFMGEKIPTETLQAAIEASGVGPTKISQIISNKTELMMEIESKSPELANAIRAVKTNCSYGRTIEEAQAFLGQSFPNKGLVIDATKELGAGSIGASYLAKTSDGADVVVKMIKPGITRESLMAEQKFVDDLILAYGNSPAEITRLGQMNKELYSGWINELDLVHSMENSQLLAKGAKNYSVAKILEVSQNGQCLIMEKAGGIQMNKLVEILEDYKLNPEIFQTKYANLIAENPWLGNPEKVINELSPSLLKAFDEQFLYLKKGGISIMHGDPHTGNFFMTMNEKGKLIPQFIDTDNCIIRSAGQVKNDITFFSNYFVGNSKKVAEYFVEQCECDPKEKAKLIDAVANDIKTLIFDKKHNIKNVNMVLDNVKTILRQHGLHMTMENTTAMKSQFQFLTNISESAHLTGKKTNVTTLIKDIPGAITRMITRGSSPISCVKDALSYATHNVKSAVGNAYQFVLRDGSQIA